VGLERDEETAEASTYYEKLPRQVADGISIIVDPMVATGGSTVAAIDKLKSKGARNIVVACIVTCPEGLEAVHKAHPEVKVYAATIDAGLNDVKYIVPGLGDAGDRLYGTV
jgi:uracil phosphoribosyltransferase